MPEEEFGDAQRKRWVQQDEAYIARLRYVASKGFERVREGIVTEPGTEFPLIVHPDNHVAVARIRGDI